MKRVLVAGFALAFCSIGLRAQQLPPAADSALQRAMRLFAETDTAGARRLLDSLATATASTPLIRGEATYRFSRLASTPADRERILAALVVDHPFSPRVPEALYELGMLELAHDDRDRAIVHLGRYLTSTPDDSGRVSAALALGRLLLERGDLPHACAILRVGRAEVPDAAIEMKNQFAFSVARCQGIDTSRRADPRADASPKRTGAYTVQVAAYDTRLAADRLVTTLRGYGLEARVVGTSKPFRVRVGRYATNAEAEEASNRVDRAAKTKSMVVIVGPEER